MPRQLDKPLNAIGPYTLKGGKLTFRTGDAVLPQRLRVDAKQGRVSTVCLLSAAPIEEFVGTLEKVELVKIERPQEWQVVMVEQPAGRRKARG